MEDKKVLQISLIVLCTIAIMGLLLGIGLGLNALLLPDSTEPSETDAPTDAPTDPPTEPPTELPTEAPTEPPFTMPALSLTAKHSFIYVVESEQFLMLKGDAEERIYPASLTKLFTTYVALQYLDPETKITTGSEVYDVEEDSSKAGLGPGLTLTVRQLVQAMLLSSGSDASMTLAAATGRKLENDPNLSYKKAIERFIEEMNTVAGQVGLDGSHFVTPDGYHHEDHYTTPRDMQKVAALALSQPTLREVMAMRQAKPDVKLPHLNSPWVNTNFLLHPTSQHYIPTAFGMKTGHTEAAGGCILASFNVEGETLIVGVFGCEKREDRFVDVHKIYNAYIR